MNFDVLSVSGPSILLHADDRIASAGSCFAANIVPFIEKAGFEYIRRGHLPLTFGSLSEDNFSYSKFSAPYGNLYTARQALQIIQRALGMFSPKEDRWRSSDGWIIDPFRPGLRYPASTDHEFDLLTSQYLVDVLDTFRSANVFVFTLGLTEAWVSTKDGAVLPACPGTIAGNFDEENHSFSNFSAQEVSEDLFELIKLLRLINPHLRIILTVSPVPLVATATTDHVLVATIYSKSVLRVAAHEASSKIPNVFYFPAYEIVTGPQAPPDYFETDRREPSKRAIEAVMTAFLSKCESAVNYQIGRAHV